MKAGDLVKLSRDRDDRTWQVILPPEGAEMVMVAEVETGYIVFADKRYLQIKRSE